MSSKVEIFILVRGQILLVKSPRTISFEEFPKLIKDEEMQKLMPKHYFIYHKLTLYSEIEKDKILAFDEGDIIKLINSRICECWIPYGRLYFRLEKLKENDLSIEKLTGILKIILLKYISIYIKDINEIKNKEICDIFIELKNGINLEEKNQDDIKLNLLTNSENNIMEYSKYISNIIHDKDIENILNLFEQNIKIKINKFWAILSKYEEYNKLFEPELLKAIKNSYFDYSLINLSLYEQKNLESYIKNMEDCVSIKVKYLFNKPQIDPKSKKLTKGIFYSSKPFYGMGIYFSDMLDYIFLCKGQKNNFGKILPVNSTFSCASAEIHYEKYYKKDIFDFEYFVNKLDHFPNYQEIKEKYNEKKVSRNGLNFTKIKPNYDKVDKKEDIINDIKQGKFIGNEFIITESDQILPLYDLSFKRNEYVIIWRDPNFEGLNDYSDFLKDIKLFIFKQAKMNAYFETSTEKALKLIYTKRFNKIILISSIGLDLSGKKFVEIARKILGFNVVVLFFSSNEDHLSWIQNFPNALYTDSQYFCEYYILNYNEKGLLKLKKKIEKYYKIKLTFREDYFKFPKFINQKEYDNVIFRELCPYFKKVIIKNTDKDFILCLDEKGSLFFEDSCKVNSFFWYVTMDENEMTLYSNNYYLGTDSKNEEVMGFQFLKKINFEKIEENVYFLFSNNNKNFSLTLDGKMVNIEKENKDRINQKFKFIEFDDRYGYLYNPY